MADFKIIVQISACARVKSRHEKVYGERLPGPTRAGVSSPRRPSPLILPDKLVDYVVVPEQVKSPNVSNLLRKYLIIFTL